MRTHRIPFAKDASRRAFLRSCGGAAALGVAVGFDHSARGFGEEGAFNPRVLLTGDRTWEGVRKSAPARWADELDRRTSAPGRLRPTVVRADEKVFLEEPFAILAGDEALSPFTTKEVAQLKKFVALGGILLVDEWSPNKREFYRSAEREIARVLPSARAVELAADSVLYKTFYLLDGPKGRVRGGPKLRAILRGGALSVLFIDVDLLGALARDSSGANSLPMDAGGEAARELAIRFALNVSMYVLSSNYKDDQVHAEHIMRRRGPK